MPSRPALRRAVIVTAAAVAAASLAAGSAALATRPLPRHGKGVGRAVGEKDLLAIIDHWWRRPYSYMFDRGGQTQGLTVHGRHYGTFLGGIDGILKYGGLAPAISMHLRKQRSSFGDLRPIERLSGLRVHRRRSRTLKDFSRYNPAIIRWGYQNLIPRPTARVAGHTCQRLYDAIFARFFRLMADSYQHLQRGQLWRKEQRAYLRAMKRRRFEGLAYLQRRHAGALPGYAVSANGTNFTAPMAVGFWVRRGIDGTARELWKGLTMVLQRYDRAWWQARRRRGPVRRKAPPARRTRTRGRH